LNKTVLLVTDYNSYKVQLITALHGQAACEPGLKFCRKNGLIWDNKWLGLVDTTSAPQACSLHRLF